MSSRVGSAMTPKSLSLGRRAGCAECPCQRSRSDAARDGPPLGAQLDRHAVRRHPRVPAARLRDDPLRAPRRCSSGRSRTGASAASGSRGATCGSSCSRRLMIFSTSSASSTRSTRRRRRRSTLVPRRRRRSSSALFATRRRARAAGAVASGSPRSSRSSASRFVASGLAAASPGNVVGDGLARADGGDLGARTRSRSRR